MFKIFVSIVCFISFVSLSLGGLSPLLESVEKTDFGSFLIYQENDQKSRTQLLTEGNYILQNPGYLVELKNGQVTNQWVRNIIEASSKLTVKTKTKARYFVEISGSKEYLSKKDAEFLKLKSIPLEYPVNISFHHFINPESVSNSILRVTLSFTDILGNEVEISTFDRVLEFIVKEKPTNYSFDGNKNVVYIDGNDVYTGESNITFYAFPKLVATGIKELCLGENASSSYSYCRIEGIPFGKRFHATLNESGKNQKIEIQGAFLLSTSRLENFSYMLVKNGHFYIPFIKSGTGRSLEGGRDSKDSVEYKFVSFERELDSNLFNVTNFTEIEDGIYEVENDAQGSTLAYLLDENWDRTSSEPHFNFFKHLLFPIPLYAINQSKNGAQLLEDIKILDNSKILNSFTLDYSLLNADTKNFFYLVLKDKKKLRRIRIENFAIVSDLDEKILDLIVSNKNIREILISVDKLDSDWGIVLSQKMSDDRETPTNLKESFNVSYQKVLRPLLDRRANEKHKEGNEHSADFFFVRSSNQNYYSNSCFDVTKETRGGELVYRITGDNGNVNFFIYPTDDVLGNDMFIRICSKNKEIHFGMYAPKNAYAKRYENFPTGYFFGPTHFTNKQDFLNYAGGAIEQSLRTGSEYGLPK